ncbi:hypothetical protein BRADI_3g06073v3 [Brachypodium distachyon]|uniref:Uncharacterized protein n=1 Tax=Brachypodium distachyon TaxID=15368 RepID=A0A0Q3F2I3_BRADI|nr:hypothetical protein BRADI_3g06073v3 [Brachypodium distachyon]
MLKTAAGMSSMAPTICFMSLFCMAMHLELCWCAICAIWMLVCYLCYLDVYADVYVAFYAVYSAVFCCYAAETIVMLLLSGSGKNTRGLPLPVTGGGYG